VTDHRFDVFGSWADLQRRAAINRYYPFYRMNFPVAFDRLSVAETVDMYPTVARLF
jgi:hypothetical protein